jgi:hypothetical protein
VAAGSTARIILRTTALDASTLPFATEIAAASGCPVVVLADGRYTSEEQTANLTIIRLTASACVDLGLYCSEDFAWRCGDYGYYLARARFPDAQHLWMIEGDVRFDGDLTAFFEFFESRADIDFLSTHLQPADRSWFWTDTAAARDVLPFRCLFPLTRLSARAIDAALQRRRVHSGRLLRRQMWPNDEALIATTLMNGPFTCRDFNDFGPSFYSPDSFSFLNPIDGDQRRPSRGGVRMVHPVLFGDAYRAKVRSLRDGERRSGSWFDRQWRRTISRVNRRLPW